MKVYVEANMGIFVLKWADEDVKMFCILPHAKKLCAIHGLRLVCTKKSLTKIIWVGWMNSFFFQWIQISPKKVCLCYFQLGKVIQYSNPNLNRSQNLKFGYQNSFAWHFLRSEIVILLIILCQNFHYECPDSIHFWLTIFINHMQSLLNPQKTHENYASQCENSRICLPLRFYVKSILAINLQNMSSS